MPLDVGPREGQQPAQHPLSPFTHLAVPRIATPITQRLFEKCRANSRGSAQFRQCLRFPPLPLHQVGEQRQPDGNHLSMLGQQFAGLLTERLLRCGELGGGTRQRTVTPPQLDQHPLGVLHIEQVGSPPVVVLNQGNVEPAEQPVGGYPKVIPHQQQRLQPSSIAVTQGSHQVNTGRDRVGIQPLLELVQHQHRLDGAFLSGPFPHPAEGLDHRQVGRQRGDLRAKFADEFLFGAIGRGLKIDPADLVIQPRQHASPHQRAFPRARRAQHQPHAKGLAGRVEAMLPERDTVGQSVPVELAGEQIEKDLGIIASEGPQTGGSHHCLDRRVDNRAGQPLPAVAPSFEIDHQFGGISVPVGRPFLQQPQADPLEFRGKIGPHFAGRGRVAQHDGLDDVTDSAAAKREFAGEHLVGDDPKREQIAATIQRLAIRNGLLGAHVRRAPRRSGGQGIILADREPEVGKIRGLGRRVDQDVRRFDVTMNQARGMRVQQGIGDRPQDGDRPVERGQSLLQLGLQRPPIHIPRDHIDRTVGHPPHVMHWHQVRMMRQTGDRPSLAAIQFGVSGGLKTSGEGHLDGDLPTQFSIEPQPDPTVIPLTKQPIEAIAVTQDHRRTIDGD